MLRERVEAKMGLDPTFRSAGYAKAHAFPSLQNPPFVERFAAPDIGACAASGSLVRSAVTQAHCTE